MSKKINTTSIGLFIVTGAVLGVGGLLLFSSSKMFTKSHDLIVYFNESLNGLSEGAPVKYRGVTVGTIKKVMVRFNQAPEDNAMPVILEIQDKLVSERLGDAAAQAFYANSVEQEQKRIKEGLRASLQTESLVTGVLYVDIQIDPKAPPPVFHQLQKLYPELPSEPTEIKQLFNDLASLDVRGVLTNLNGLIVQIDEKVAALKMDEISNSITNALVSIRPTLDQYRELGARLTGRVDPFVDNVNKTLTEANRALAQIRGAGENLRVMLAPDSPVRNDLDQALEQLAGAAQSISSLTDFLKQHPNALIAGRELPKK